MHVATLIHGIGSIGIFSSRAFLPAFITALLIRIGPQFELLADSWLLRDLESVPSWFTHPVTITILGLLAALEIADDYPDLPDHIALELNYLAHLVGKERQFAADADEAKLLCAREMERDFLAGHVLPWIGPLRDKIHEKSQHAYFRSVADMAATFAEQDLAMLEESLGASAGHSAPRRPEPES